jgi:1-acyl-sn-glycerol-3-phosphate acyltransferase
MTQTWRAADEPETSPISLSGWLRVVLRGALLAVLLVGGLVFLLLVRLIERPIWQAHRPWTPRITQFVCRMAFVVLGMKHRIEGTLMTGKGAVVANHSTWLDIFTLNARKRIYFVSKSEVANWPGVGLLARATGQCLFNAAGERQNAKRTSLKLG